MGRPRKTDVVLNGSEVEQALKVEMIIPNDNSGVVTDVGEDGSPSELSGENNHMGEENTGTPVPSMSDVGWSEFIMSEFDPSELDDKYPKCKGFQRLVRKHVGTILESSSRLVQLPTPQNLNRASAEHKLVILKTKNLDPGEQPYTLTITEVADAYIDNIKGDLFAAFPPAIASTRARVRALRLALNVDMVAAEELPDPNFNFSAKGEITDSLISKIDTKCHQLNIDLMKFINIGRSDKPGRPVPYGNIKEVKLAAGQQMFKTLNEYQKDIDTIPEKIVGYRPTWRTEG